VIKPVGPTNTVLPAAEKPAEAPIQVNEVKPGGATATPVANNGKQKKPKTDLSEDSSSKKKKKKGLARLNPF
jgi:outer membrane protein assembly factor BamD